MAHVRSYSRYILLACSFWALAWQAAPAADHLEEFNKARRTVQLQLRSKRPANRIAALQQLQAIPIAESVRLIHASLGDSDEEVRERAFATLAKMSGNQEVCDTLFLIAKKNLHRNDGPQAVAPVLAAVLSSSLPSVRRDAIVFLDEVVAASKNGAQVIVELADQVGSRRGQWGVQPLVQLSKTKTFANHFGVRRAVVGALCHIPTREAIGTLIEMMDKVGGEAEADAVEHLTQVTGQIFAMDGAAWGRWWDDVQQTFEYPTRSIESPYRSVALNSTSGYYYGLPLFAQRLVFVLDTSGSMTGQRIVAAKRELNRAIEGLPADVSFGLVVFNGHVTTWQKELVQATAESKTAAMHYVNAQATHSNTASYDALETALEFDTEAIYFLSDGAPYGGKISAPVDIVAAITAANKTRRVSIYTIGIGAGIPGGPLDLFLKTLAEQNLGLYRRVDG
jgi:hypothetical protein